MRILGECDHKIKKILDWSLGAQDVQVCVAKSNALGVKKVNK
jgi:hypothetical protein